MAHLSPPENSEADKIPIAVTVGGLHVRSWNVLEDLILNGMALCFTILYLEGSASVFNFIRNYNKVYF